MPRDWEREQPSARSDGSHRLDAGGVATAPTRAAHRPPASAKHGRALRSEPRHLACHHAGDGRQQAGDDRSRRVRHRHDDGDVHRAARQADPRGGRGEGRALARDAGVHRGSEGAGDHALPHPGHRSEDGQVPRRHEDSHARRGETGGQETAAVSYVPHVVAWNLTRRCNLECAHCYISAGPRESATSELETAEAVRIVDELVAVNPAPLIILSGGEPLLRHDLTQIAAYAAERGATVVVGTNGTLLTDERIAGLKAAGVRGVAVSIDSLRPSYHDNFRHGKGSLEATTLALGRLRAARLDFIIQTTATKGNRAELERLAQWSAEQGAVAFNCYFLVATGRGAGMSDLSPAEYEAVLADLARWQREYRGTMMVRAKCAPHFMRHVHAADPASPILNYETRCPCGTQYCRITPDGKLTPCPYLPEVAGDLRAQSFVEIWRSSPLFRQLREGKLGGKCGSCEYQKLCGGCRARAFALEGDVLAADPSCVYEPAGTAVIEPQHEVSYGQELPPDLTWSAAARSRLDRIPSFVRGVVAKRVEDWARERGLHEVTPELLTEIRKAMPLDFSKKRPFFVADS